MQGLVLVPSRGQHGTKGGLLLVLFWLLFTDRRASGTTEGGLMPASQRRCGGPGWCLRPWSPQSADPAADGPQNRAEETGQAGAGHWRAGQREGAWQPAPQGRRLRMDCGPGRPAEIRLAAEESRDCTSSALQGPHDGRGPASPSLACHPQSHSGQGLNVEHGGG